METNRKKNTVRNIIWGILNKVILLLFPFVIRTIIIRNLGSEYLGLSSLFTSILQVLNLTELGFSSAIIFSMYKPVAQNDTKTICALMNFYKKIYRIIGIIIIVIGLLVLPFIPKLINGSYPNVINIYILYIIYLFNTAITYFLFAYKSAILVVNQRSDILSNVNTIIAIFQFTIQIAILCIIKNYYLYVFVITLSNIMNNLTVHYIVQRKYPNYICQGDISKEEKKQIQKKVYGLMIQKVCATTRNSLDSIFLSAFLGLNIVAIYNNYYTIMISITSVLAIFTSSMVASIGNSIVKENVEKNYKDLNKFNFMYMWLSGWCAVCLLCLYQPFMRLWMGENMMFSLSTVICFVVYFYVLKTGDILSTYHQAAGLWYEGRYRAVIETILNIILNYLLGKYFGVNGIIIATIISILLINFGYGSTIIFRYYFTNKKIVKYYMRHLFYFLTTSIAAISTYFICDYIAEDTIIGLIIRILVCILVPNIIFMIIYNKYGLFKESIKFVKEIFQRKK